MGKRRLKLSARIHSTPSRRALSRSTRTTEEFDPQIGLIREMGWPLTKASYLRAMYSPDDPPFPFEAEDLATIPEDLPGPVPPDLMDLF